MPWVNQEMCAGCGTCVDECPVGAISLQDDGKSLVHEEICIRCGTCHDICPEEAVRHDSERIPQEIAANIEKTRQLLRHFETPAEQRAFIGRMIRYFNKQRKVAEQTIEQLQTIEEDPVNKIESLLEAARS